MYLDILKTNSLLRTVKNWALYNNLRYWITVYRKDSWVYRATFVKARQMMR